MNNAWIEERPNGWTYQLKCPKCGYVYSPQGYEDGTNDYPHKYCPECGEKLESPKKQRGVSRTW